MSDFFSEPETAERYPRRDPLWRRGLGARAGYLATGPVARRAGLGDALVFGRGWNRVSLLGRVLFWFYEFTPQGLKRESEIDPVKSITDHTGRKLDFAIIGGSGGRRRAALNRPFRPAPRR